MIKISEYQWYYIFLILTGLNRTIDFLFNVFQVELCHLPTSPRVSVLWHHFIYFTATSATCVTHPDILLVYQLMADCHKFHYQQYTKWFLDIHLDSVNDDSRKTAETAGHNYALVAFTYFILKIVLGNTCDTSSLYAFGGFG